MSRIPVMTGSGAQIMNATQYATFTSHVYGRPPAAIRDLLEFGPGERVPMEDVEPAGKQRSRRLAHNVPRPHLAW